MTNESCYLRVRKKLTLKNTLVFAFFSRVEIATAAAASATGTALATVTGYDPWTWVVGGLGAAIVYVKKNVTSRLDAITNGVVSVMLAGLVSPGLSHYLATKFSLAFSTPYPVAFVLSASWPWIVPTIMSVIKPASGGK
jgi:uncharacterized membrane protein YdcZ (DUF606 family)